jgi:hypothetical protein
VREFFFHLQFYKNSFELTHSMCGGGASVDSPPHPTRTPALLPPTHPPTQSYAFVPRVQYKVALFIPRKLLFSPDSAICISLLASIPLPAPRSPPVTPSATSFPAGAHRFLVGATVRLALQSPRVSL